MSKMTTINLKAKPSLVVFGLDSTGKPKAARFPGSEADAVRLAADTLKLTVCEATNSGVMDVTSKLPAGRVHAKGKAFVPYVKQELYDQLLAVCGAPSIKPADKTPQGPASQPDAPAATTELPVVGRPKTWETVAPGHLVIRQESLIEGWWEAIVVKREGEIVTIRYRDYPKAPLVKCHINTLALLHPGLN